MRRLTALVAAALILASCGGSAAVTDPYQIIDKSGSASYDAVQVNVGFSTTVNGTGITIDPSAIQLIVDKTAGKGEFKLALPVASLGADASSLAQLGITNGNLDLDVVWDGQALYANGPVLTTALTLLMTQAGTTPGDLSGWLRLGTKADFEALVGELGALGGGSIPSMAPLASHDAASIKKALEEAGITVTYVGAEKKGGKDASHLAVAFDMAKLQASDAFKQLSSAQAQQLETAMQQATVAADVWVDSSSYRLVEMDLHVTPKDGSAKADVTILVSQPSDTSGLTAPATYTDVPMSQLLSTLLKSFGQGLIPQ